MKLEWMGEYRDIVEQLIKYCNVYAAVYKKEEFMGTDIPISYAQAVLGDKVTVPTIKGKVEYEIPEGTQSGTKFRLRGEGVKYLGRESYGDQYVTVVVEVPKRLTKQQKELLKKFDDCLEEKNQAKRQNFFEKLKRRFEA